MIPEGQLVLILDQNINFLTLQLQFIQFTDPVPLDVVSGHTSKGKDAAVLPFALRYSARSKKGVGNLAISLICQILDGYMLSYNYLFPPPE
jgi:hypothetical protein